MAKSGDTSKVFSEQQILLPDISYKAFSYPGDEEALNTLKNIPGAAPILTWLQQNFNEQLSFLTNNEQMIRAGHHNYPSLYTLLERCSQILSCPVPELYLTTNPVLNAYTSGQRRTCIVLHSSIVEQLTIDELAFVIGHEIGHIKCAHGLYRLLGDLLLRYWDLVSGMIPIPGVSLLRIPLLLAYWEWYRRAEFTCDRAGLLCLQELNPCLNALGKLAGKVDGYAEEFDIDTTIKQAEAHKEVSNKLVILLSILENAGNTHPFVPRRLKILKTWAEGDEYTQILGGEYEKDTLGTHEGGERIKCECGTIVNSKLSFCPECGRDLHKEDGSEKDKCAQCGAVLPEAGKFCPKCGAKRDGSDGPPPPSGSEKLKNTLGSMFKKD